MSEVREMTVKEMLGLLEWHEQMGRGDFVVKADPRGLCFLKLEHVNVNIVAPPDGETHCDRNKSVFLKMIWNYTVNIKRKFHLTRLNGFLSKKTANSSW